MEKLQLPATDPNPSYPTWTPSIFSMDINPSDLNSSSAADCFFNHSNWDTSIDQNDPFESALSSIVSSPTASYNNAGAGDGFMMSELIGRLGIICSSGDNQLINSTNTSCYTTPLNSPPKPSLRPGNPPLPFSNHHPGLAPFNVDPRFAERAAAKYYSLGSRSFNGRSAQLGFNESKLESGRLSRVSSCRSTDVPGVQTGAPDVESGNFEKKLAGISRPSSPRSGELGDSREGSSVSEQNPGVRPQQRQGETTNSKKRKSNLRGKGKEVPPTPAEQDKVDEWNTKRSKAQAVKKEKESAKMSKDQNGNAKPWSEGDEKPKEEPPKDYIHVRARRGQATDSHSLAERVRREKISERMKFLQDLVPGCSKVTGKAIVLDEIINYVQSLQRQVEFLSMKLATVHPMMELNVDSLLSKDSNGTLSRPMFALDPLTQALQYAFRAQGTQHLQNCLSNDSDAQLSLRTLDAGLLGTQLLHPDILLLNNSVAQLSNNLHNVAQAGIVQNRTQATIHGPV